MFWSIFKQENSKSHEDPITRFSASKALESLGNVETAIKHVIDFQQQMEESKRLWEATFNSVNDCIAILDKDGLILQINKSLRNVINLSKDQIIGKKVCEVFCDQREQCRFHEEACITKCNRDELIKDGKLYDIYVNPIIDEYLGKLHGCVFVARDITERRQFIKDIEYTRLRYKTLFDQAPYGILIIDPKTTLPIEYNDQVLKQLEYSRDEFATVPISSVTIDHAFTTCQMEKVLEHGYNDFITKQRTRTGKIIDVHIIAKLLKINGALYIYCIHQDITAQEALRKSEIKTKERYQHIFNAIKDPMFLIDEASFNILDTNEAATIKYGYSKEELLQMKAHELSAEPEKTKRAIQKEEVNIRLRLHKTRSGKIFPVEISSTFLYECSKRILLALVRDITDKVELESELATTYANFVNELLINNK